MKQGENAAASGRSSDIELVGLSVVLVADGIDPSSINQDMLRHAEIVPSDLEIKEPPFSTPAHSQIIYENNVAVVAEPRRLWVDQQGEPLNRNECIAPDIVKCFLEKMPHLGYRSVGINLKSFMLLEGDTSSSMLNVLRERGEWLSFKDMLPEIGLKIVYRYEGRAINMEVSLAKREEESGHSSSGLFFHANIHRNVSEIPKQSKRIAQLSEILSDWEQDVTDFCKLASKFLPDGTPL